MVWSNYGGFAKDSKWHLYLSLPLQAPLDLLYHMAPVVEQFIIQPGPIAELSLAQGLSQN